MIQQGDSGDIARLGDGFDKLFILNTPLPGNRRNRQILIIITPENVYDIRHKGIEHIVPFGAPVRKKIHRTGLAQERKMLRNIGLADFEKVDYFIYALRPAQELVQNAHADRVGNHPEEFDSFSH